MDCRRQLGLAFRGLDGLHPRLGLTSAALLLGLGHSTALQFAGLCGSTALKLSVDRIADRRVQPIGIQASVFELSDDTQQDAAVAALDDARGAGEIARRDGGDQSFLRVDRERPSAISD